MKLPVNAKTRLKAALLLAALAIFAANCFQPARKADVTITASNTGLLTAEPAANPSGSFGAFSHSVPEHQQASCDACHHRESSSAKLNFPAHDSCIACHITEFTDTKSAICASCHSDLQTVPAGMKAFPARFIEGFNMKFDHSKHSIGDPRPPEGCVSCHLPAGASQSIPAGLSAHTTCYTCHSPESKIGSCNVCHTMAPYNPTPTTSNVIKAVFRHSDHSSRQGVNCAECHTVRAVATQSRQVGAPSPVEHALTGGGVSCRTCHNDRRAFGENNFNNCSKCHSGAGFTMLPAGHSKN